MANNVDPDQTAPIGAVCSGSTLFDSILNSSVMLGKYLQQTTSADDIFRCIFFLELKGLTLSYPRYSSFWFNTLNLGQPDVYNERSQVIIMNLYCISICEYCFCLC